MYIHMYIYLYTYIYVCIDMYTYLYKYLMIRSTNKVRDLFINVRNLFITAQIRSVIPFVKTNRYLMSVFKRWSDLESSIQYISMIPTVEKVVNLPDGRNL